jgi:hypothetical protein
MMRSYFSRAIEISNRLIANSDRAAADGAEI